MSKMALELRAWKEVSCYVVSCNGRWYCYLAEWIEYMI